MDSTTRSAWRLCVAAALLAGGVGAAQAHVSVGVSIGLPVYGGWGGVGVGFGPGYYGYRHRGWARPWGPGVVLSAPLYAYAPPVYVQAPPPVVVQPQAAATPAKPDPVIYPRNAQNAQQTEYDRQECNRWATTQPAAVADATVFQRAVEACMDGRGYTMR